MYSDKKKKELTLPCQAVDIFAEIFLAIKGPKQTCNKFSGSLLNIIFTALECQGGI
jgi:hypothetical protein